MPIPQYIGEWVDFPKNIQALAVRFDSEIRTLEEQRARVASGPNAESLRALDIEAIDATLRPLRYKAAAAHEGLLWVDPRDVSGADASTQKWKAMARKAGCVVYPEQFGPSLHDQAEDDKTPIRVLRGGERGVNLGAPASTMR